ncbi:MAG: type VII secretion protein EccB [Nocardioides sp.]|nr:type VII secretion protein EccB [Nocardioides sp.]
MLETDPEGAPRAQAYAEPGEDASAADLPRAERDVRVEPGAGAIFVVGDWSGAPGTSTFVVDSTGTAFNLEGPDTLTYLGYGDMTLPVVPDAWLDMFDTGVVLSPELALCPPQSVEEATECA